MWSHLYQPGLEVVVDEHVEAQDLEVGPGGIVGGGVVQEADAVAVAEH